MSSLAHDQFEVVKRWDFDPMEEKRDVLLGYIHTMFGELGLLRAFKIPVARLHAFALEASNRYSDEVPYHNFEHAWSVLHACYLTVSTTAVIDSITLEDTLGLFVGAICHDAGHRGTNNAFHISCHASDERIPYLAMRYNDISVLENYHACQCFDVIQTSPMHNIFQKLSPKQFLEVRKIIIESILATDMVHHTTLVANFEDKASFNLDSKDDRQLLVNTVMHASDLANPVLPQKVAVKWALRVATEFKAQANAERKAGLPVTSFMDIDGKLNVFNIEVAKLNYNFISYVVQPLWSTYVDFFPELHPCLDNLKSNQAFWRGTIARAEAATQKILL